LLLARSRRAPMCIDQSQRDDWNHFQEFQTMLYPRESETREVNDLNGLWNFRADTKNAGLAKRWFAQPLTDTQPMAVPASYNDLTQDVSLRDHIGVVWYERTFFVPTSWKDKRVVIRVGAAAHTATLYVNGVELTTHKGGFLPFEAEIDAHVIFGGENRITLSIDNTLDWTTLPVGEVVTQDDVWHNPPTRTQMHEFDFFNYSGIHRAVKLFATPKTFIDDIATTTDVKKTKSSTQGLVNYAIRIGGDSSKSKTTTRIQLIDESGKIVATAIGNSGKLVVDKPTLWQPGHAYLYTLVAQLVDADGTLIDCTRLAIGIRTIRVTKKQFLINGEPFFFKGFSKHDDADIRGKGFDYPILIKDFNLMKWVGANSFRTAHYPYSEELMDLADRQGWVVIDEVPAVGMMRFGTTQQVFTEDHAMKKTLPHHLQTVRELIDRDKNHPCVVMWSLANEARTDEDGAVPYFRQVIAEARKHDPTRPLTMAGCFNPGECKVEGLFDVICINRYFSWYTDCGHLELIEPQLEYDLRTRFKQHSKPIIITEFGVDTIPGFHQDPPVMFTEEYQNEFLRRFLRVVDKLDFAIGAHVWNFADFATNQGVQRIVGNRKGVFTRQRQPKSAAFVLRELWQEKK
jgi:beta-glucuronidase